MTVTRGLVRVTSSRRCTNQPSIRIRYEPVLVLRPAQIVRGNRLRRRDNSHRCKRAFRRLFWALPIPTLDSA